MDMVQTLVVSTRNRTDAERLTEAWQALAHQIARFRAASESWGNDQTRAAKVSRASLDLVVLKLGKLLVLLDPTDADLDVALAILQSSYDFHHNSISPAPGDHSREVMESDAVVGARRDLMDLYEDAVCSLLLHTAG